MVNSWLPRIGPVNRVVEPLRRFDQRPQVSRPAIEAVAGKRVTKGKRRKGKKGGSKMPDKNGARRVPLIRPAVPRVALATLIVLKLSSLAAFGPTFQPDSVGYATYADQILNGSFRHVDLAGEAMPITLFRSIGFPAVIAAAKIVAGRDWAWAVVFLQFGVSLFATFMVYRLARMFGLGLWASVAVAGAQATTVQFVVDQAILSDSLCGSAMTIATCVLGGAVLRRKSPHLRAFLAVGLLIVIAFLMRNVVAYMAIGLIPLVIAAAATASTYLRRLAACGLVFIPLVVTVYAYMQWNRERVGAPIIASTSQAALFGALTEAAAYDPTIFSGSTPIDDAGRQAFSVMASGAAGYEVVPSEILHRDYGWSAVRISKAVSHAYLEAWLRHPAAMIRHTLDSFDEKQLEQAVRPIATIRAILVWNTGSEHEFAHERAVLRGQWWMLPFVIAHRAEEGISAVVFVAFLLVTPFRLRREGLAPQALVCIGCWCAYVTVVGLYAAVVYFHARYLTPVLADSIVIGASNIAWMVNPYRSGMNDLESFAG